MNWVEQLAAQMFHMKFSGDDPKLRKISLLFNGSQSLQ